MRIAYWTVDEVNLSLAREFAEVNGAMIEQVLWKNSSTQDVDAILYDLDFLPPDLCGEALPGLMASPPPRPAAVHGYNLEDGQIEILERHGIAVHRSLDSQVLGCLCDAILQARIATLDRLHERDRHKEEAVQANGIPVPAFNRG
jgi:hypothetical protein